MTREISVSVELVKEKEDVVEMIVAEDAVAFVIATIGEVVTCSMVAAIAISSKRVVVVNSANGWAVVVVRVNGSVVDAFGMVNVSTVDDAKKITAVVVASVATSETDVVSIGDVGVGAVCGVSQRSHHPGVPLSSMFSSMPLEDVALSHTPVPSENR